MPVPINKLAHLASELESLAHFAPRNHEDLYAWLARARRFRDEVLLKTGLAREVPEFLWAYLDDAEARFDDELLEARQNQLLQFLIRELRRGRMPNNAELKL